MWMSFKSGLHFNPSLFNLHFLWVKGREGERERSVQRMHPGCGGKSLEKGRKPCIQARTTRQQTNPKELGAQSSVDIRYTELEKCIKIDHILCDQRKLEAAFPVNVSGESGQVRSRGNLAQ